MPNFGVLLFKKEEELLQLDENPGMTQTAQPVDKSTEGGQNSKQKDIAERKGSQVSRYVISNINAD